MFKIKSSSEYQFCECRTIVTISKCTWSHSIQCQGQDQVQVF